MSKLIIGYAHCRRCLEELPGNESPESYARLSVGFTKRGWQIWCVRHDLNVAHIDFEGANHPADLSEAGDFGGQDAPQH